MNPLLDLLPILLFFYVYKSINIHTATITAILTITVIFFYRWKTKNKNKMHVISFCLLLSLGGLTIILHDDIFIKLKTTIVYWIFSIAFYISSIFKRKSIIKYVVKTSLIKVSDRVWCNLDASWSIFFLILGCINLYIMYNYGTNTWINFKLFGTLSLTLTFILIQCLYLIVFTQETELLK